MPALILIMILGAVTVWAALAFGITAMSPFLKYRWRDFIEKSIFRKFTNDK